MNSPQIWDGTAFNYPETVERIVRRREDEGFDGRNFGDSQNRYGDPFVCMGIAARATSRLMLGTGVTNPVTRHPALMANVAGTVQAISNGRCVIGLARGDSALAHIGMAPAPLPAFEKYVRALQLYLSGQEVPFQLADESMGGRRPDVAGTEGLGVGKRLEASRMQWIPGPYPKVILDIYATGPKLIAMGAVLGDRLTFAVGADIDRLQWALSLAREARAKAGLDPNGISYGAVVGMGIDDNRARGRARIAGVLATSTRFSFMHGAPVGPMRQDDRVVFEAIQKNYDMTHHATTSSTQASLLPDWFADRHAITGGPATCVERIQELYALGLDRLIGLFHGSHHGIEDEIDAAYKSFATSVIPHIK